jgi:hypothetical protein
MEHAMSSFSTISSADAGSPQRDESAVPARAAPTHIAPPAVVSLPRYLLVSLAGITAEVEVLGKRCAAAEEDRAAIQTIIGRLDGLVDSIYAAAVGSIPFGR